MAAQQQPQDFTVFCDSDRGPRQFWAFDDTAAGAAAYVDEIFNIPLLGRWVRVLRVEPRKQHTGRTNAALFSGLPKGEIQ